MAASATEYFLSTRPVYPWSEYPLGMPALGLVATALIGITLWTYLNHPQSTRRRITFVVILRILALAVALLTALRPSVGIQEDPKIPSTLLIGIDLSESMTNKDEINSQRRIDAVKKVLEKSEPILEDLRNEQNVNVVMYGFGKLDFNEATDKYTPQSLADARRTDIGAYLNRTFEKWQTERFVRSHLLISDGIDNGTSFVAQTEASRWRNICPLHTFAVGSRDTLPNAKDVGIIAASIDPTPVPTKNDVTIKAIINAFGFSGAKVPIRVFFNDEKVSEDMYLLRNETNNEIIIKGLKAPPKPGEVKVKIEVPVDRVPGDVAPANNVIETYMSVSKEGIRVLLIDRLRFENTYIRDALRADKRFDVVQILRQRDEPGSADEKDIIDFESRAYDVIILGNISARQLNAIDPGLMNQIRNQVVNRGAGLLFLGGDASYLGNPTRPIDNGFRSSPLEPILPVSLTNLPNVPADWYTSEDRRFQIVPTLEGMNYLMKVGADDSASKQLWDRLNDAKPPIRLSAISKAGTPKPNATVYALTSPDSALIPAGKRADQVQGATPLLVGWQQGTGNNPGRVLAFLGHDSFQWKALGLRSVPRTRDGIEIHSQFWRRLIIWLAKQEEEEGAAYARPEFRRIPVNTKQSIKVGLRQSGGADAIDPQFSVRIVVPGQKLEDTQPRVVTRDPMGANVVVFDPPVPGEYVVVLSATGKDSAGKETKGEATARFLSYAEASDEMLRVASDYDYLEKLAKTGGGKAYRLEDLPQLLKEMKAQKLEVEKKPRFVPDWSRKNNGGFLPFWLVVFVTLLGVEWAFRRLWGLA